MTSCRLMTVCVLLFVAWLSTAEGACKNRCLARCDVIHKYRDVPVWQCYRQCVKLARTCAFCIGPRRCLRCKPKYVPTRRLYYGAVLDGVRRYYIGRRCVPNKCKKNNGGCISNQKCVSYWTHKGAVAFKCVCRRGLVWNGKSCIGALFNLARGRNALIDTDNNQDTASLLIDGKKNTVACSEAQAGFDNWLAVDLGKPTLVTVVVFYNEITPSGSSDGHTLDRVKVGVSNTKPTVGESYDSYELCRVYSEAIEPDSYALVECPRSDTAYRYVVLQSSNGVDVPLCAAEVEVYYVEPGDYVIGCYSDPSYLFGNDGWFDPEMTHEKCLVACYSLSYKYGGLKTETDCYCANSYESLTATDTCVLPCSGNPDETCGGGNGLYDGTVVNVLSTGFA